MAPPQAVVEADGTDYAAIVLAWSPEERKEREKKFLRKIDLRLMPMLMVMFIFNYIDRNSLPQTRVMGLEEDLGLVGTQYQIVLSLTFIGYILLQVPSNMLLSIFRPSIYLAVCMGIWGLIAGSIGAVQNFSGLAAARFLLGMAEAPFFPGCAFLFSGWYTRKELGTRLGLFYCAAMLSSAFTGLFAAGIGAAFANNDIAPWRWLFIIEGAATVVAACVTVFVIPDWPATTKWLSGEERALGVLRIAEDAGDEEEDISPMMAFKLACKDHRVWLCIVGQTCVQAVGSLSNFLPTLIHNFGFSSINSLLLTAPPWIFVAFFGLFNGWISDRTGNRSRSMYIPNAVCMIGIIITMSTTNIGAQYFALFLMMPGAYGTYQTNNSWMANIAARPQKKRAVALAMNNAFGNLSIVWTPYLFLDSMSPRFFVAWSVLLALIVIAILSTLLLSWLLRRDNKKMEMVAQTVTVEEVAFDQKNLSSHVEAHGEAATAGRALGGRNAGAIAKYDT